MGTSASGSERDNHRNSPRSTVLLPAEAIIGTGGKVLRLQSVIHDISLHGALVSLARGEESGLDIGMQFKSFELAFRLPRSGECIHAPCSSVRFLQSKDDLVHIGVQFNQAFMKDIGRLRLYLAALESLRGQRPEKNGARALVMDDDEIYRILVRSYLEQMGFEVREATNGGQGMQMLRKEPADLVVVDILMPEKDGLETIRELKTISPETDIIAISAGLRGVYNPLDAAKAMGATRILKKPFDREMLTSVLLSLPRRIRQLAAQNFGAMPGPALRP